MRKQQAMVHDKQTDSFFCKAVEENQRRKPKLRASDVNEVA
jgi:hypothetical protein